MPLTLQVTAGQRPFVSQRDFTFLVSSVIEHGVWVAGGTSLPLSSHPPTEQYVRAWQHPTCMEVLLNKDYSTLLNMPQHYSTKITQHYLTCLNMPQHYTSKITQH